MENKKYGRTHEECDDCLLVKTKQQLYDGHVAGPSHCETFIKDDTEDRIQAAYELGQIVGLEEAGRALMEKAKNSFVLDRDKDASLLKKIYKEFTDKTESLRKDFDKKHKI